MQRTSRTKALVGSIGCSEDLNAPLLFPNELDRFLDNDFATMGSIIGMKSICIAAAEAEFAKFEYQSNGHAHNE
jgi:hypothetical protein